MSKRVLISSAGVKLSKPGVDVTTASGLQLLFDATARRVNGVFKSGVIHKADFTTTTGSYSSGGATYDTSAQTFTLIFGKTFAARPRMRWGVRDDTYGFTPGNRSQVHGTATLSTGVTISTTQAVFQINYSIQRGQAGDAIPYQFDMAWVVFQGG